MYVKDSKVDLTQNSLLLFEERRKIMSYNYRQLDDFQLSGVSGGKKKFDCAATFVTGITAGIGSGTITGLAGGPFGIIGGSVVGGNLGAVGSAIKCLGDGMQ